MDKSLILTSYRPETWYYNGDYTLMGPQLAATSLTNNGIHTKVLSFLENANFEKAINFINDYFEGEKGIIGFAYYHMHPNIISFAQFLKSEGHITYVAGPNSREDYLGEIRHNKYEHRFQGYSDPFYFCIQGDAENAIPIIKGVINHEKINNLEGLLSKEKGIDNQPSPMDLEKTPIIDWSNRYIVDENGLREPTNTIYQVLGALGCAYAKSEKEVDIPVPSSWKIKDLDYVTVKTKGCTFCKDSNLFGYQGNISLDKVLEQITNLPRNQENLAFHLIDEFAVGYINKLTESMNSLGLTKYLIEINARADHLIKNKDKLLEASKIAEKSNSAIFLSTVGFESFNQEVLEIFNKGTTVETNKEAISTIREISQKTRGFDYTIPTKHGKKINFDHSHGWIFPTPWDTKMTYLKHLANKQKNLDVMHEFDTPLFIHHASPISDFIREVEEKSGEKFERHGNVINWLPKNKNLSFLGAKLPFI